MAEVFVPGKDKKAEDVGDTVTMFFPHVVHLRLSDHSLLKFNAGPQEVPTNLLDAEKEILVRHGVKPIKAASKQAAVSVETAASASADVSATSVPKKK